MRVELRCVSMAHGEQYVMMDGARQMLELSADSLDILHQVVYYGLVNEFLIIILFHRSKSILCSIFFFKFFFAYTNG